MTWRFGRHHSSLVGLTEEEYIFEYYSGVGEVERKVLEKEAREDYAWAVAQGFFL